MSPWDRLGRSFADQLYYLAWACWCCCSFLFPLSRFVVLGSSRLWIVGRRVLVLWLNRRCAGLVIIPCMGVFLWLTMTRYGSVPALIDFFSVHLAIFTPDSALPLALLLPGLLVRCWRSHVVEKLVNSSDINGGPLSLVTDYLIRYALVGKMTPQLQYGGAGFSAW